MIIVKEKEQSGRRFTVGDAIYGDVLIIDDNTCLVLEPLDDLQNPCNTTVVIYFETGEIDFINNNMECIRINNPIIEYTNKQLQYWI